MTNAELKPCPFCGGEASHNDGGNSVYGRLWWSVWCNMCQFEVRDREVWDPVKKGYLDASHPPKECFTTWNTRAAPKVKPLDFPERRHGYWGHPGGARMMSGGEITTGRREHEQQRRIELELDCDDL